MNNQSFNIHWKLAEDYPTKDGEFLVCYLLRDNTYGDLNWAMFSRGEWQIPDGEEYPAYWTHIPCPVN